MKRPASILLLSLGVFLVLLVAGILWISSDTTTGRAEGPPSINRAPTNRRTGPVVPDQPIDMPVKASSAGPVQQAALPPGKSPTSYPARFLAEAGTTEIVAELPDNGAGFALDYPDDFSKLGLSTMRTAILGAATPAQTKLNMMADIMPLFTADGEAIAFLSSVAADAAQPDDVRVEAVMKLADFGPEHVAQFQKSDSTAVAEEVDLLNRLESHRRQENLPPGKSRVPR